MNTINLKIISPEKEILSAQAYSVDLPTKTGRIGVLPHHEPIIGVLESGVICVHLKDDVKNLVVTEGFFEVKKENAIVIFVADAQEFYKMTKEEIEQAKKKVHDAVDESRKKDEVEFAFHNQVFMREIAKLSVLERYSSGNFTLKSKKRM
jgi:F-type H+-transporting ATPase subunit epsilon